MGGLQGVPFLQGQQPPDDTSDLENRAAQAPQQLGQALQNQQQQPPQQQAQPQGQQPDPIEQLKSQLAQQATPQQGPQGGPVRRALQNFFSGMGQSMMHEAGLPTEYEKQQKALGNLTNLTSAQGLAALHQAVASQNSMVQFPLADGTSVGVAQKDVGHLVQSMLQNKSREAVADTAAGAKVDVANINQGGGLQLPVDANTAQLAGSPELAGTKLGKGGWAMLNSALTAKGYHVQDMGKDGADGGMWVVDKGGNKVNQVSPHSVMVARGQSYAQAKAENTPFETVEPGTNIPATISAAQAIRTGAPRVPLGTQQKLGGQYALYKDAYGILDNIDRLTDKVNVDDPAVRARVTAGYAALKDPSSKGLTGEFLSNFLARQPINGQLQPDERELVLNMAQGKAAATGLRSILGQAGSNEMQQRLDSGLFPGGQTAGSKASIKAQTQATRALLGRFQVGQPQVGLNAPGSSTALQNQTPAPEVRIQLPDGRTGTVPASSLEKYQKMGATVVK